MLLSSCKRRESSNFVTFAGYGQMRRNGVLANPVGNACSHTTMVDKGLIYCKAMVMSNYYIC